MISEAATEASVKRLRAGSDGQFPVRTSNFGQNGRPPEDPVLRIATLTSTSAETPTPGTCDGGTRPLQPEDCALLNLLVPARVIQRPVLALVDTAAQATLVRQSVCEDVLALSMCDGSYASVKLEGLGGHLLQGWKIPKMPLTIGKSTYTWDVIAIPMSEEVILGLDFLKYHRGEVNLADNTITLNGELIDALLKRSTLGHTMQVSRIMVSERQAIPPNSVAHVRINFSVPVPQDKIFCAEATQKAQDIVVARAVLTSATTIMRIINDSERQVILKKGFHLANATEVSEIFSSEVRPLVSSPTAIVPIKGSVSVLTSNTADSASAVDCRLDANGSGGSASGPLPTNASTADNNQLPIQLQDLFKRSQQNLSDDQVQELSQLLQHFHDVFAKHDLDLGCFTQVKHHIDTEDARPFREKMRRTPIGFEGEEQKHLEKMVEAGVIVESSSDWASAPVLVRKKDGSVRYCIDFRRLNSLTVKDAFPLPLIEDCMDTLAGTQFFSTLDLASGYYQIELDEVSQKKTAFITRYGLFEHTRMGFGLCNAPATFQRAMNLVLRGLTWKDVLAYIDDVMVLGKSFEEHLDNLRACLLRFRQNHLKLKPKKCVLFQTEVEFLGKTVSRDGVRVQPSKIEAITTWPTPKDRTDVQSFLGFANYHREHIRGIAGMAVSLYELAAPKTPFQWSDVHQKAFEAVKQALVIAPCLGYPRPEGMFVLDTDASDTAIGAELSQVQDGVERVIGYSSHVLHKIQRRYCTTRKELLAVIKFCRHYRHYLLGRPFLLRTDHSSLVWLIRFKRPEGQLARWLEEMQQYDLKIVHRPGKQHCNVDGLSRRPDAEVPCD